MILSCSNLNKSFVENIIIKDASFHIEEYDKVAIVGKNGAGKTTLIKMLMGRLAPDSGIITLAKQTTVGYLAQNDAISSDATIINELTSVCQEVIDIEEKLRSLEIEMQNDDSSQVMEQYSKLSHQFELKDGFSYKSRILGVLKGLGFEENDYNKLISTLSGGQKTRVALGKLLLQRPDIIVLDEPTNHLDINSIAWLETYLLNYKGSVILVSHDRYFLDKITNKIIEIDSGEVMTFQGNYSDYAIKKEHLRITQMNAYLNQQREIKHQEEVIDKLKSFNREKSIKRAESREKMLDKVERLDKPQEYTNAMQLKLSPRIISGNDVLEITNLAKSFEHLHLFENVSFNLKRGERVALIGDNGTGKTTILKIINGILAPDEGNIKLGSQVHIGYYDQEHNVLNLDKTMFEEIQDAYPTLTNTEIRNTLAAFLFTGDDVFKKISMLSGGERGRVSLAKLMLSKANFLILDEPTNHLDIASKEILEYALNHYSGTILYVSHDRYFVNKTATRILELSNKDIKSYLGNYDDLLITKEKLQLSNEIIEESINIIEDVSGKLDWKEQKEKQANQRKISNELKKVEARIEVLENMNTELNDMMNDSDVATNSVKLQDLTNKLIDNNSELELLYEKWEELSTNV